MPPELLEVRPESLAVLPGGTEEPVVFVFDERISEQGVEDAVMVSPRTSPVQVDHSRNRIRVSLRGGWEAGQIYQIEVRPELQDLWNNRLTEPLTVVFSTGPPIPDTRLAGTVEDRITGQPEMGVRVEAIRTADSLVYATATDSVGFFSLSRIPTGEYRVRAYQDASRDRALDPFEPRDTAAVAVTGDDSARVELAILAPDSTAPVLTAAELADSMTVHLTFDDYLDPTQRRSPSQFAVLGPDGGVVPIARAAVGELALRDTVAPIDSVLPPPPDTAAVPPSPAEMARPGQQQGAPEPLPSQRVIIELAAPLPPDTEYRVTARDVRNLVGLAGGGDASFTTPAEPSP